MLNLVTKIIKQARGILSLPVVLTLLFVLANLAIWWLLSSFEWRGTKPFEPIINRALVSICLILFVALAWGISQKNKINHFKQEKARKALEQQDPYLLVLENQEREFTKILEIMKKSIGDKNPFYLQPWYLVLGSENTGKSSFIQHSEQNFTFSSIFHASGFTRENELNFNWWIGNDVVLIEPEGQLFSQHENSNSARRQWLHFINWLETARSQRPLNGIILIIEIEKLLNTDESFIRSYAEIFRARLKEVMDTLGSRLPVYIILTKMDRLHGFDAFFRYYPKQKREAAFGFAFSLQPQEKADLWLEEFACDYEWFITNLNSHFNYDLADRSTQDCQDIFSFIRQLIELKSKLNQFFRFALQSDRFSTSALVRGIYFTSVVQQNKTINLFESAIAQRYNLPLPTQIEKKSKDTFVFFNKHLFSNIILPESGLATDNLRVVQHKHRLAQYSVIGCSLISIALILGWNHYYQENYQRADEVLLRIKQYNNQPKLLFDNFSHQEMLNTLNIIHEATFEFGIFREKPKIFSDMGLYQGHEIGPKIEQTYLNLLKTQFLPYLINKVIIALNQAKTDEEKLIQLRIYRMLTDQNGRQQDIVNKHFEDIWQKDYAGDGKIQDLLLAHLSYAMQYIDLNKYSISGDPSANQTLQSFNALITKTQQELNKLPNEERIYKSMSYNARTLLGIPINLQQQVGPSFELVFQNRNKGNNSFIINKFFTKEGFEKYFIPQINSVTELALIDSWVLGNIQKPTFSDADKNVFQQKVRALYVAEYINTWQNSLNALDINKINNIPDAILVTDSLLSNTEPMQRLLREITENTNMYDITDKDESAREKLLTDPQYNMSHAIEMPFSDIHQLLSSDEENITNISEVLAVIYELNNYLKTIHEAADTGMSALDATKSRIKLNNADPIYKLERISRTLPSPINRLVHKIATDSWRAVKKLAIQYLAIRWKEDVYDLFIANFANRYPFFEKSQKDVSLEDFSNFFAPNGVLDNFYNDQLKWLVEESKSSDSQDGLTINKNVLNQIKQAEKIREAFFNQKGVLGISFTLQPLRLSSNKRRSLLYIDGQLLSYSHGSKENIEMIWPNTFNKQVSSKVTLIPVQSNLLPRSIETNGAWALFRLLNRGRVISASETSIDYQFRVDSGLMSYRLLAEEIENPFTNNILSTLTFSKLLY